MFAIVSPPMVVSVSIGDGQSRCGDVTRSSWLVGRLRLQLQVQAPFCTVGVSAVISSGDCTARESVLPGGRSPTFCGEVDAVPEVSLD